jgi:ADP-ribose pyrophosphatase YjhB (NUDIX family)
MTWKPHLTVAAVIENAGRFLLVQERISGQSVYNQPAGHLEDKESLVDAVIRETLEETAWHFKPEAIIGIYRWRHPDNQESFIRVSFRGQTLYHDPDAELDDCIERILWLTHKEIRQQQEKLRSPMVMRSIDDYLSGESWPLSLLIDIEND